MKRLLLVAVWTALCAVHAEAQKVKILERSAKKVPTWVGGAQNDYIITQAFAADLETAKAMCLEDVRKQSIRAVAENVASSSEGSVSQVIDGGEMVEFVDTFMSTYQTQSADVPFLKGISASKIEAYYWEKQQTGGQVKYLYAIKYPFPSVELKALVREFEKRFDCLIARQIARCSDYFQRAAALEELLERDGRRVFNRMYGVYHRLLVKIAAKPARILLGRVRLSLFEKIAVAVCGR